MTLRSLVSMLLVVIMLFVLCACGQKESAPSATTTPQPSTTQREPGCVHVYTNADCANPKTCTLCGATRGSALGHDYNEGICNRCGQTDSTYVPLLSGQWSTEALNETGGQMECVVLRFHDDGSATLFAKVYNRLYDVPEDQRSKDMLDENNWYDYSGEIYYYTRKNVQNTLTYAVEGKMITCTLLNDDVVEGTLILERTGGNMLTVTYYEGAFAINHLQVGDVLSVQS